MTPPEESHRSLSKPVRLRLTAAAESRVRSGHPWVFGNSVTEVKGDAVSGSLAVMFDRKNDFLAIGLYDALSPIRCRVLSVGKRVLIDRAFWLSRIREAFERRANIASPRTTGLRWIHGENDGMPGLVLDAYGSCGVVKLYTPAWLPHLSDVFDGIKAQFGFERLVLRLSRNLMTEASGRGWKDGTAVWGELPPSPVVFSENGILFEADVVRGQKTGFFLDQRENRAWLETQTRDRTVLNAFSFSGGFSLYAARGGARSVCDLDISSHALRSSGRNFDLNRADRAIDACVRQTVQADAFEWLKENRQQFDVVVVDPPSLAKREMERARAVEAYGRLIRSACERLSPGGLLLAASCSAHVNQEEFFGVVLDTVKRRGDPWLELRRSGHPADHPSSFPEAAYLKCIAVRVG
ncbi:MAG: class I SAM-dependent rRNA methyltransferase [Verrucomicrobia bacterium]|nr:class I SAM-dependent rRNA methyltransferase [Verrucomicrobiota bacterium]